MPTRLARAGQLLITRLPRSLRSLAMTKHSVDITKSIYAMDSSPIDKRCGCYTCQNFSRAYLNHLFKARELLSYRLATIHNLWFMNNLVTQIREAIVKNKFLELKREWLV